MAKQYGKTFVIQNDTLSGKFPATDYENCTLVFRNCTFINFSFYSKTNAIEFLQGNQFCEAIYLDATKVVFKNQINTDNLNKISINGGYFKMPEGAHLTAFHSISITSDLHALNNNQIRSMDTVRLQSSKGTTTYRNCDIFGKNGVKITAVSGDLILEHCDIEVPYSNITDTMGNVINGIYVSGYGSDTQMKLSDNVFHTDVLEIVHPDNIVVNRTQLNRVTDYGRFTSRNHEHLSRIISYNCLEPTVALDDFYPNKEQEKENNSKILQLFGSAFKKSA